MTRSNSNLNQAKRALQQSVLPPLRELVVEQAGQALVISGQVGSFYHKQMAQEIVRSVCRDIDLQNTVDVERRVDR